MFLQEAAGLRKEPRGKLVGVICHKLLELYIYRRSNIIFMKNACTQDNITMLLLELNEECALSIFYQELQLLI